ncbi:hypothetical protein OG535_04010 [Kitasatospora sp. NBC_00085]|uniref:hypothetical protein n=1 Tax=unclassified Kitasatospora TaxID=2633591 RepID=UPI0032507EA8
MDPLALAAGSALVGAMATDAWQQARSATVALWRRVRPEHADDVGSDLDVLRRQVLAARVAEDADTEQALAAPWRLQLQQLLRTVPGFADELRRLLDDHLLPMLPEERREGPAQVVMRAEAHDHARVFMAGRDQHITGE